MHFKNGCNWCDLPKDLPPYSTVFWHYKQWRAEGIMPQIMEVLHQQVRKQVKKTKVDNLDDDRLSRCKSLVKNFARTLENATAKLNLCFV